MKHYLKTLALITGLALCGCGEEKRLYDANIHSPGQIRSQIPSPGQSSTSTPGVTEVLLVTLLDGPLCVEYFAVGIFNDMDRVDSAKHQFHETWRKKGENVSDQPCDKTNVFASCEVLKQEGPGKLRTKLFYSIEERPVPEELMVMANDSCSDVGGTFKIWGSIK